MIYGEILNFIIHMIYERSRTFHNIARPHHTASTDHLKNYMNPENYVLCINVIK